MLEDIKVPPNKFLADMLVTAQRLTGRNTHAGP